MNTPTPHSESTVLDPIDFKARGAWTFQKLTFGDLVIEGACVHDAAAAKLLQQTLAFVSMRRPYRGSNDPMREHGKRYMLADEIKLHLRAMKIEQCEATHVRSVEKTLEFLMYVAGNIPVSDITKAHILETMDVIKRFPCNPRRQVQFKGKSVAEILAATAHLPPPVVAPGTLKGRLSQLNAFFNSLLREPDKLTVNPVKAANLKFDNGGGAKKKRLFSRDELAQVFDPHAFKRWADTPHRWWMPMLALYTGARLNELAQLRVEDVVDRCGILRLNLCPYDLNTVKNKSSIREVPVAQALLDAGFLDFVSDIKRTGHPRLFPHLKRGQDRITKQDNGSGYGAAVGAQFSDYTAGLGLPKGRTMHGFRHYFIDTLRRAGVREDDISVLTGHAVDDKTGRQSAAIGHYMGNMDEVLLHEAAQTLSRFNPRVDLIPYRKGQFARLLADTSAFYP